MKRGVVAIFLALFWLGCVGDDGREVIGSYAPDEDAGVSSENGTSGTRGEESAQDEGSADASSDSTDDVDSHDGSE